MSLPSRPSFRVESLETRRLLASIAVNTLADIVDAGDGVTSLREAVTAASPGDTIDLTNLSGTITLTGGEILLDKSLTIDGPGSDVLAISGNDASRIFRQTAGPVAIDDLTLRDGNGVGGGVYGGRGGAYYVQWGGDVAFNRVVVRDNDSTTFGGAIFSSSSAISLTDSALLNNAAVYGGGGILFGSANLTLLRTTVAGNSLTNSTGAGVYWENSSASTLTITDSTIADNESLTSGSATGVGLYVNAGSGDVTITGTTIAGNGAPNASSVNSGLYIQNSGGSVTLRDVLIAGSGTGNSDLYLDTATAPVIEHVVAQRGSTGPDAVANGTHGNLMGTPASPLDVRLGTLGNHGGLTPTVPLLAASVGIDAGSNSASATDQRGVARVGTADVGSFEFGNRAPTDVTFDGDAVVENATADTLVGTFAAVDPDTGDTHTFSVVGEAGPFAVNAETGAVTLATSVDYEEATSHTVTVRATDSWDKHIDQTFTVNVTDVSPPVTPGEKAGRTVVGGTTAGDDTIALALDDDGHLVVTVNGEPRTLDASVEAIYLSTGDGNDTVTITAGGPAVWLETGAGDDVVTIQGEDDGSSFIVVDGGAGNDLIEGTAGRDALYGGEGNDTLLGHDGRDFLSGGDGDDSLLGGEGDDTLDGGLGDDSLNAGNGNDAVSFLSRTEAVTVDLATNLATADAESDMLASIEQILGGEGDDVLIGDAHANFILGMAGDDTLRGNAGKDTLIGGLGSDLLDGGDDIDHLFAFGDAATIPDRIIGGGGIDLALADEDDEADLLGRPVFTTVEDYLAYLA